MTHDLRLETRSRMRARPPSIAASLVVIAVVAVPACRRDRSAPALASAPPAETAPVHRPWLENEFEGRDRNPLGGSADAIGIRTQLAGHPPGTAVFDADRGLIGYVRFPRLDERDGFGWVGLGEADEVLAATYAGVLYAAPSPRAAVAGQFVQRAIIPGAEHWDAARGLVAAAAADGIHVSTDGGRTFRVSRPTSKRADKIFVRGPSTVLVVVPAPSIGWRVQAEGLLSLDAGGTWRPSSYAAPGLMRVGSWITDSEGPCAAALGLDGSWRMIADHELAEHQQRLRQWPIAFTQSEPGYQSPGPLPLLDDPQPVTDEGPVDRAPCRAGGRPDLAGRSDPTTCACRDNLPVQLEREEWPMVTPTLFQLADDGLCAAFATECRTEREADSCSYYDEPVCAGAVLRRPHAVMKDLAAGTAEVLELPPACTPVRLLSARGLGILLCRQADGVELFTIDRTARWEREVTAPAWVAALDLVRVARDGTIELTGGCEEPGPCGALVRRPALSGAADAWWTVQHPRAVGYRLLPDGAPLAIEAHPSGGGMVAVTVWRLARGAAPEVVKQATVPAPLRRVKADEHGVVIDEPLTTDEP